MRSLPGLPRAQASRLVAVLAVIGALVSPSAVTQDHAPSSSSKAVALRIEAVLGNAEVRRHIRAWGLTVADVQHDVGAMTVDERTRLAALLTRQWRGTDSQSPAALQAQFLVMTSLMRESTLFASVIATRPARLLR